MPIKLRIYKKSPNSTPCTQNTLPKLNIFSSFGKQFLPKDFPYHEKNYFFPSNILIFLIIYVILYVVAYAVLVSLQIERLGGTLHIIKSVIDALFYWSFET